MLLTAAGVTAHCLHNRSTAGGEAAAPANSARQQFIYGILPPPPASSLLGLHSEEHLWVGERLQVPF